MGNPRQLSGQPLTAGRSAWSSITSRRPGQLAEPFSAASAADGLDRTFDFVPTSVVWLSGGFAVDAAEQTPADRQAIRVCLRWFVGSPLGDRDKAWLEDLQAAEELKDLRPGPPSADLLSPSSATHPGHCAPTPHAHVSSPRSTWTAVFPAPRRPAQPRTGHDVNQ
jgi:hypothetical protein